MNTNKNLTSIKGHNSTNLQKITGNNSNIDLVNINAYTKFGKFLTICSKDIEQKQKKLTSIKGHTSVTNLRKMTGNDPNLDIVNINEHTNLVKFYQFILKILSGNTILTSVKGHNSITNVRKMMWNNTNLDLVSINAYTQFGKILSYCSRLINNDGHNDRLPKSSIAPL